MVTTYKGGSRLRSYIFTDAERKRLRRWLETGEEDETTRMLFVDIRRNVPRLKEDLKMLVRVHDELALRRRWRGRVTGKNELESLLRRVGSALNRIRRGDSTSAASNG